MPAEAELKMSHDLPKKPISSAADHDDDADFDPSAPPPFTISQIRAAIPSHCWVQNPWRSLAYFLRDVFIVLSLLALALHFDSWFFWPLYWPLQGTMFWALFVIGHDCGHGSFSNISMLNSLVGHISHCVVLIPFHGWRLSHKLHHQNHGHVENDESWVPMTEKLYKSQDRKTKMLNFTVPFQLFAFPIYLWKRSPGKEGSHFNPYSKLFSPKDRKDVTISTLCWLAMASLLLYLSFTMGPTRIFKLYGVPYLISVMWLDAVTYLQHHGYKQKLPWYRGKEWSYLRGGLTTVDRDYGWINNIHHDVGTHVIHHLFPQIPHYHLIEATKAAMPVLGKYYREPVKSGPVPVHLIQNLIDSLRQDHFVSDSGDIVFYQTDLNLYDSLKPSLSDFIFLW